MTLAVVLCGVFAQGCESTVAATAHATPVPIASALSVIPVDSVSFVEFDIATAITGTGLGMPENRLTSSAHVEFERQADGTWLRRISVIPSAGSAPGPSILERNGSTYRVDPDGKETSFSVKAPAVQTALPVDALARDRLRAEMGGPQRAAGAIARPSLQTGTTQKTNSPFGGIVFGPSEATKLRAALGRLGQSPRRVVGARERYAGQVGGSDVTLELDSATGVALVEGHRAADGTVSTTEHTYEDLPGGVRMRTSSTTTVTRATKRGDTKVISVVYSAMRVR